MISETKIVDGLGRFKLFLQKWEGGTSSRQTDYAKKCHSGIHTVKGITWCTYKSLLESLGSVPDYDKFLNMSESEWNGLANLYLTRLGFDGIVTLTKKNPFLAFNILEVGWMSGAAGAERLFANQQRRRLGIVDSNITKKEIIQNYLDATMDYNTLMISIYWSREKFYKSLGQPENLKGWMRRLWNLYYNWGNEYIKKATIYHDSQKQYEDFRFLL